MVAHPAVARHVNREQRPAVAARDLKNPVATPLAAQAHATVAPFSALRTHFDAITELAGRVAESNIFFEPLVLDAAAREERHPERLRLVLVWNDAVESSLIGALPLYVAPHHWGPFCSVLFGWKHDSGIRGTPLIAPGHAHLFWQHALTAMHGADLPRYLVLPTVAFGGEAFDGLTSVAAASGRHLDMFDRQSHIVLKADADGEAFLQRTMSARRYKRMAKNRADLARLGRLESKLHTDPGEVMVALRHFLELEAAGWKGRENGAILKKPDALRFFLRTICDLAEAGRIRLDALELDGVPIGMSIVALSGHTAYCWKTTFDERYAKYSPGMLTVMDVTRGIIADPTIRFADSCTDAGHPLMSHVWSDTAETVDVLVDLEPGGSDRGFALAVATEGARRRGRATAKRLYHAVRNRLRGRRK